MDTVKKIGLFIYLLLAVVFFAAGSGSYFWYQPAIDSAYLLRVAIADTIFFIGLLIVSIVLYIKRNE